MSAGDESPSRYDKLESSSVRNTFHSIRRYGLPTIEEKPKLYRPSPGAWMVAVEEGEGEEGEECGANSSDQRSSTLSSARSSPSSHCHRPEFVNSSPPLITTNAADGMAMTKTGGNPSVTASFNMTTMKSKKCARCDRTVFQAEQVVAAGDRWHRSCFRCLLCGKSLELGKFCDKSGEIYCSKCYAREYGPKGIGCGGVLQMHQ